MVVIDRDNSVIVYNCMKRNEKAKKNLYIIILKMEYDFSFRKKQMRVVVRYVSTQNKIKKAL